MASEYKWNGEYILDCVHPIDYFNLRTIIVRRKAQEKLIELSMIQSPHTENPNEIREELVEMANFGKPKARAAEKLDREGLQKLKSIFQGK